MTLAVCFDCGHIKCGAFTPCTACGKTPRTVTEFAYSMAMSDHHLPIPTLQEISILMEQGQLKPELAPECLDEFRKSVEANRVILGSLVKDDD